MWSYCWPPPEVWLMHKPRHAAEKAGEKLLDGVAIEDHRLMAAIDPTFYRSPGAAVAAAPEQLAYVAACDPAGIKNDALAVVDCDVGSSTYGGVVGWAERASAGNAMHQFGR